MKVGVLALQGAFARHAEHVESLGWPAVEVRTPADLAGVDLLVLPGGESTTISMLLERAGLWEPLAERVADGMPTLGTCAGMILLGHDILDGRPDQRSLGAVDIDVRRNAYGRQVESFETAVQVAGLDVEFPATFIRAPVVERVGPRVDVLASVEDRAVLCRQGPVLVASFHPELSDDGRIHELFLRGVT